MNWLHSLILAVPATLGLWALALITGLVLAVPVATARMSSKIVLRIAATIWIEVLRGVPTLVWLFLMFFGLTVYNFSPTAMTTAILALGIANSAYFAEVYRSGFESVGTGQHEALRTLGMPRLAGIRLVALPQALPIIIDGCGSFAILLLKETALASLIGVVELMHVADYAVTRGANGMTVFVTAGVIYTAICLPVGVGAHLIGRRLAARAGMVS